MPNFFTEIEFLEMEVNFDRLNEIKEKMLERVLFMQKLWESASDMNKLFEFVAEGDDSEPSDFVINLNLDKERLIAINAEADFLLKKMDDMLTEFDVLGQITDLKFEMDDISAPVNIDSPEMDDLLDPEENYMM